MTSRLANNIDYLATLATLATLDDARREISHGALFVCDVIDHVAAASEIGSMQVDRVGECAGTPRRVMCRVYQH